MPGVTLDYRGCALVIGSDRTLVNATYEKKLHLAGLFFSVLA